MRRTAPRTAAKTATKAQASKDGFNLKSADGAYSLRFRGYIQADGRFFPSVEVPGTTDNLLLRRARPILEATVGRYFDFRLMPDFGGTSPAIFDAYWEGKFVPAFTVRAGKFKPPVGIERLQSATDISFAERGFPTNLVPSRDIGLQVAGDISEGVFAYQVGVFNGVPDLANGGDDLSDAKDFAARVFVQPFKAGTLRGLGVGVGASTGIERGTHREHRASAVSHARASRSCSATAPMPLRRRTMSTPTASAPVCRRRPTSIPGRSASSASTPSPATRSPVTA